MELTLELLSTSLTTFRDTSAIHSQRYFSTDGMIKKNLNSVQR